MSQTAPPWPTEIRLNRAKDELSVTFDNAETYRLPAEMLRVMSPSAEVQGHSADQRVTVGGKRHVKINEVQPVGNYAVKIRFADGHDTGIYAWGYLLQLGREQDERWAEYLAELKSKGLKRE